jgi:hypothetical protein
MKAEPMKTQILNGLFALAAIVIAGMLLMDARRELEDAATCRADMLRPIMHSGTIHCADGAGNISKPAGR